MCGHEQVTQRTHRCRGSGLEDQEGGLASQEEESIDQPRQDLIFPVVLTSFALFGGQTLASMQVQRCFDAVCLVSSVELLMLSIGTTVRPSTTTHFFHSGQRQSHYSPFKFSKIHNSTQRFYTKKHTHVLRRPCFYADVNYSYCELSLGYIIIRFMKLI